MKINPQDLIEAANGGVERHLKIADQLDKKHKRANTKRKIKIVTRLCTPAVVVGALWYVNKKSN